MDERSAHGLRKSPFIQLTDAEIEFLKQEIEAIHADERVFRFNRGSRTSYVDDLDIIYVRANVFPDEASTHPRDLMSPRAVLAHEYYGHRTNKGTRLPEGSWKDEFRASYNAARYAPNLSIQDRMYLVLDAVERAKEAGVTIKFNRFMRSVLYGYDQT